mmetsp:Transcript_36657/g.105506  ORF Transcript_36657/g.105506 Transcript_36657/m.105506 type:complete len:206 (+) Transcript_36657:496-1113(+)
MKTWPRGRPPARREQSSPTWRAPSPSCVGSRQGTTKTRCDSCWPCAPGPARIPSQTSCSPGLSITMGGSRHPLRTCRQSPCHEEKTASCGPCTELGTPRSGDCRPSGPSAGPCRRSSAPSRNRVASPLPVPSHPCRPRPDPRRGACQREHHPGKYPGPHDAGKLPSRPPASHTSLAETGPACHGSRRCTSCPGCYRTRPSSTTPT